MKSATNFFFKLLSPHCLVTLIILHFASLCLMCTDMNQIYRPCAKSVHIIATLCELNIQQYLHQELHFNKAIKYCLNNTFQTKVKGILPYLRRSKTYIYISAESILWSQGRLRLELGKQRRMFHNLPPTEFCMDCQFQFISKCLTEYHLMFATVFL